jgi:hypothetical protein
VDGLTVHFVVWPRRAGAGAGGGGAGHGAGRGKVGLDTLGDDEDE